jgi:hypothetical protein
LRANVPLDSYFSNGNPPFDLLGGKRLVVSNGNISLSGNHILDAHDYRLYKKL